MPVFLPNSLGGLAITTHNIAKHLAKLGHEIHVITSWHDGLPVESMEEGFFVHRIQIIRKPILGSLPFLVSIPTIIKKIFPDLLQVKTVDCILHAYFIKSIFKGSSPYYINILKIIKKINPDLLHVQTLGHIWQAYVVKFMLNKPYLVYGHGSDVYYPDPKRKHLYPHLIGKANAVIAVTNDMAKTIQNICNRNITVIPNGIDLHRCMILPRKKIRPQLGIKQDEAVILFIGDLRSVKGIDYLIEAMDILRRNLPNTRLMIVGDGIERKKLEEQSNKLQLTNMITFVGQVSHNRVYEYLSAADMFVLPSISEGLPNVILEAMAVGLPIVTTKVRGNAEIIIEGKNGLLVNPEDSCDLASKLMSLLKNEDLRNKMSEENKDGVKRYSLDNIVRQLEAVYSQVIESSSVA